MTWPIPTLPTNWTNASPQIDAHPLAHNQLADAVNELAARVYVPPAPPPWIAPTFENGWMSYGAGYPPAGYRKVGDVVQIQGLVKNGTATSAIFTLPVGYRPPVTHFYATTAGDAFAEIQINTNGGVIAHLGSTAWFSLGFTQFSVTAAATARPGDEQPEAKPKRARKDGGR